MHVVLKSIFLCLCVIVFLIACSQKSIEQQLSDAESSFNNEMYAQAIIELKNAASEYPDNSAVRLLLARSYLKQGRLLEAKKEFLKAEELGESSALSYQERFRLEYLLRNFDFIQTQQVKADDDVYNSTLAYYSALSSLTNAINTEVPDIVNNAVQNIKIDEQQYIAILNSYLLASSGDSLVAIVELDKIIQANPQNLEALVTAAEISSSNQDYKLTSKYLKALSESLPYEFRIKFMLANALLKSASYEEAELLSSQLLKSYPKQPLLNLIKGVSLYQKSDFRGAKLHLETAIQSNLNNNSISLLAGLSNFQLEQYEQAYNHFLSIKESIPSTHPIRRVIAQIELKLGYTDALEKSLNDMEGDGLDSSLYEQAGFAYLQKGELEKVRKINEKLSLMTPEDSESEKRRGLLKLSINDLSGIIDLEKSIDQKVTNDEATLMLASTYIREGEYKSAVSLAEKLINSSPSGVHGYLLKSIALLKLGEIIGAEESFSKVLELQPEHSTVLMYKARKALSEKNSVEAITHLNNILDNKPSYLPALNLLFDVELNLGNIKNSESRIAKAFNQNKESFVSLLKAKVHFFNKEYTDVIETLNLIKENDALPRSYWELRTRSLIAIKEFQKVEREFEDWIGSEGSLLSYLSFIQFLEENSEFVRMNKFVNRALNNFADNQSLKLVQISALIYLNQIERAKSYLNAIQNSDDENIAAFLNHLNGRIQLVQGNYNQAISGLVSGYEGYKSTKNAFYVYAAYVQNKQLEEAEQFMGEHSKLAPKDIRVKFASAQLQSQLKYYKKAVTTYEAILEIQPNSVIALNNIANQLHEINELESANLYITKALQLVPQSANVLHTASVISFSLGQYELAKERVVKALDIDSSNEKYSVHLDKVNRALAGQ